MPCGLGGRGLGLLDVWEGKFSFCLLGVWPRSVAQVGTSLTVPLSVFNGLSRDCPSEVMRDTCLPPSLYHSLHEAIPQHSGFPTLLHGWAGQSRPRRFQLDPLKVWCIPCSATINEGCPFLWAEGCSVSYMGLID